jgi:ketosteroid isomerase-like protein
MDNRRLIEQFYTAFRQLDAETMISCYHEDITFKDPAFGKLQGIRARAMWQMLCQNAIDLSVDFTDAEANDITGSARWQARYTFSKTGRRVHNKIMAKFRFKDGKIIDHEDSFNLWRWSGQALGWQGMLLGGTSFFRTRLQQQTNKMLDRFLQNSPSS